MLELELLNHSDASSRDVEQWVYKYDMFWAMNFSA